MENTNANVSRYLSHNAQLFPHKTATILTHGHSITFSQMEAETCRMAFTFQEAGIKQGMRVAMFVKPGLNFVPAIFGLFRLGAIPVFIDPGMKLRHALACVAESKPSAMIGIPLAHALSKVFPKYFRSIQIKIALSSSAWLAFCFKAKHLPSVTPILSQPHFNESNTSNVCIHSNEDSPAAIIFTSGSTGIPKGVEITHGILDLQTRMIRDTYVIEHNEVDLVPFPLFALFSAAWGITSVIPKMNPGKPSKVNGHALAHLINTYQVTHAAGSPAIWQRLFQACDEKKIKLPSLKRILMAGAPVSEKIIRSGKAFLPEQARIYTPYGATEALPLTSVSSEELLETCFAKTKNGQGTCVGKPLLGILFKIIRITDGPILNMKDSLELPQGTIGEIIVTGPIVTRAYFNRQEATMRAKIEDTSVFPHKLWHRMGDLGYIDESNRLWFCGRKDHRITLANEELYAVQCEGIFNQHPYVLRSALVGVHNNHNKTFPVLVVQTQGYFSKARIKEELLELARKNPLTQSVQTIVFKNTFPLDTRHNIKIDRIALGKSIKLKF